MTRELDGAVPAVRCSGLGVRFGGGRAGTAALEGVDLTVAQGEFLTLLGPSGSGKSTLLRVIADLLAPSQGSVEVLGMTPHEARMKRAIGFVFQDPALLPWRTAIQNVDLPNLVGDAPPGAQAPELLALVGLSHKDSAYPHQLSGGERQRVAIARALVRAPRILLMDEPFGALDEITRERLQEVVRAIWRQTGVTVVFVTHSIQEAVFLGQRVAVLSAGPGRVVESVSTAGAAIEADAQRLRAHLRRALAEDAA